MTARPDQYPANLPILYRNIMDGLPSDFARDVFLWAVDRTKQDRMLYKAEQFARDADCLLQSVKALLSFRSVATLNLGGRLLDQGQEADLIRFIMARHANTFSGGNSRPSYAAAAQ